MPSIPSKQPLVEFLSRKGFWVFYPRWRGAWESGGQFLQKSPDVGISLMSLANSSKGVKEIAFHEQFDVSPDEVFVIGGSFGGAAALASLEGRVKKVIANCPVVDWGILDEEREKETSNPSYPAYIRDAFGNGYRLSDKNWNKLRGGKFFNPMHHVNQCEKRRSIIY